MKKDNINYSIVGFFVISSFALLLYILFQITGVANDLQKYYVVFDRVNGIKEGASVTYGGYKIGQVDAIFPVKIKLNTAYKMTLSIKSDWSIPQDSRAMIVMPGLMADKQIDIIEGQENINLKPGDEIQSKKSNDIIKIIQSIGSQLETFIPKATGDTQKLLSSLNQSAYQLELFLNEKNRKHISNMLKQADAASFNLSKLAKGFDDIQLQLNTLLSDSNKLITDNKDDLRQSVLSLRDSMQMISNKLEPLLYNMSSSSRNLNEFSRQIRNHPASLISSQPPADKME